MPDSKSSMETETDRQTVADPGAAPGERCPSSGKWLRFAVQAGFAASVLLVGWQFHLFVASLEDTAGPLADRPESVEAWLPISSLMSLTLLAKGGGLNRVHPAGLVIFSLTLLSAVILRRGFCSWVCPIGTLSEYAHKAGRRVLGRNFTINRWVDYPLRSLKYLLLGFFVWAILSMPAIGLREFIHGPYNRVADVKMYLMFADISAVGVSVMVILLLLSAVFKNFWCRYLCPYGALLGLLSLVSPVAVRRDADQCLKCGRCSKACPNSIRVAKARRVRSVECTACFTCVSACPKPGALGVSVGRRRVSLLLYAVLIVGAFILVPQAARAIGYWQSETPDQMYRPLYQIIHQLDHVRTPGAMR